MSREKEKQPQQATDEFRYLTDVKLLGKRVLPVRCEHLLTDYMRNNCTETPQMICAYSWIACYIFRRSY